MYFVLHQDIEERVMSESPDTQRAAYASLSPWVLESCDACIKFALISIDDIVARQACWHDWTNLQLAVACGLLLIQTQNTANVRFLSRQFPEMETSIADLIDLLSTGPSLASIEDAHNLLVSVKTNFER